MTADYTPRRGSLGDLVCAFFRENPDEELTRADVASKFNVPAVNIDDKLRQSMAAGFIVNANNDELVRVWRAGPNIAHSGGTWPAPRIEPTAIVIRKGVTKPPKRAVASYLQVIQQMQPTDSVELPLRQARGFYSAAKQFATSVTPPQQFSFRKLSDTHGAVWRDA